MLDVVGKIDQPLPLHFVEHVTAFAARTEDAGVEEQLQVPGRKDRATRLTQRLCRFRSPLLT